MSEFRYCKLYEEWVLFAPQRLKRPTDLDNKKDEQPGELIHDNCPFDLGKEEFTPNEITRIEQDNKWKCRVVPNMFNALSVDINLESFRDEYFEKKTGMGAHEIVIETPNHDKQIFDYDYNDFINYFSIIQQRVSNLQLDSRLAFISVFKNQGKEAGASIRHSHSQIMALPFLPKKIKDLIKHKKAYYKKTSRALLDDLVYEELQYKKNIVLSNSDFVVYCPYASRNPFEVKIVSLKKLSSLSEFTQSELSSLSDITKEFFYMFYKALGDVSFNMIINNAPYFEYDEKTKEYFRFNIEIIPRIYKYAGFELSTHMTMNVIYPNKACSVYKEKN